MKSLWSIIYWNLWQRRWSIFWWSIGVAAFIAINLAFYPSFKDQAAEFEKSFSQIPESARALFSDTGDFLSPTGYLSSQVYYLMLPMLTGILAISLGASLIAREEQSGSIELLLSRPVSRTRLLVAKLLVGIKITAIVSLVAGLVTVGLAKIVELPVPLSRIALASLACYLLSLSFGMVAFFITMLGKARVASIGLATLFALGGYIIASLKGAADWLKYPAKVFPFDYYQPGAILEGHYNWWNMTFVVGILVFGAIASWLIFNKRDLAG